MPEIIHYIITQTRTVDVSANKVSDAVRIAEAAFENGQNIDNGVKVLDHNLFGVYGNTTSRIRETALEVERKT